MMLNLFKRLLTTKYLIQVNYKSGISMKFWVYKFSMTNTEKAEWIPVYNKSAMLIGINNIESVYCLKIRKRLYNR